MSKSSATKPLSRNGRYEAKQRNKGLTKTTVWIPEELEAEFKQLALICSNDSNITFNVLRDKTTNRFISLERYTAPVTGDTTK